MNKNSEKGRFDKNERSEKQRSASSHLADEYKKRRSSVLSSIRVKSKAIAASLPTGLLAATAAFFLGRCKLLFGSIPLGFAFLCAATEKTPYISAGLFLSSLTLDSKNSIPMCVAYLLTLSLRLAVRAFIDPPSKNTVRASNAFGESIFLRMASSSVTAFSVGLWHLVSGGFYIYDLRGAVFSMIVSPLMTGIFDPLFHSGDFPEIDLKALIAKRSGTKQNSQNFKKTLHDLWASELRTDAAYCAVFCAVVLSVRNELLFGFSPAYTAALFLALLAARRKDSLRTALCGFSCGLAADPVFAPVICLASIAARAMFSVSVPVGAALAAAVVCIFGVLIKGLAGLLIILPASVCGMALFCGCDAIFPPRSAKKAYRSYSSAQNNGNEKTTYSDLDSSDDINERIQLLSDSFGELSSAFFDLAEHRRRPGEADCRRMADEAGDEICVDCSERRRCWELEYDTTLSGFCRLAEDTFSGGKTMNEADLPGRCTRKSEIFDKMRCCSSAILRKALEDERLSLLAADYRAVSAILDDAAKAVLREQAPDGDAAEQVRRLLDEVGIKASEVRVFGERKLRIEAVSPDLSRCRLRVSDLRRKLESVVGTPLSNPAFCLSADGSPMLTLSAARRISVSFSAARGAPDNQPCGDTVCRIENSNDYFYALICDGMGRGGEAAFTAGVCSVFLKRMLSAQNSVETSLRLLNSIIRKKGGEECSAGIDLLEIDLLTGKAALYKGGAAPSYLKRKDKIYSLSSQSVPLGIICELDAGKTEFALEPGDLILMISDGVLAGTDSDSNGSYVWLLDLLSSSDARSLDETARRALRMARIAGSCDDASAAVIAIGEQPPKAE